MKDPKPSLFLANMQLEKLHTRQTDGLISNSGTNSMPLSAAKMKQKDTFHKTFIFHSSETIMTNAMRL
jgi:uncharacterized phosphosugar-binding protein